MISRGNKIGSVYSTWNPHYIWNFIFFFVLFNWKLLQFGANNHILSMVGKCRLFQIFCLIKMKITCKFGGQWSKSSNMCLMFCASWITKFNSMSNSPPTSWKEKITHNFSKIKMYSLSENRQFHEMHRNYFGISSHISVSPSLT